MLASSLGGWFAILSSRNGRVLSFDGSPGPAATPMGASPLAFVVQQA